MASCYGNTPYDHHCMLPQGHYPETHHCYQDNEGVYISWTDDAFDDLQHPQTS